MKKLAAHVDAHFSVAVNVPKRFRMRLNWLRSVNEQNTLFAEAIGERIDQNTIWSAPEDTTEVGASVIFDQLFSSLYICFARYPFRSSYDSLWTM